MPYNHSQGSTLSLTNRRGRTLVSHGTPFVNIVPPGSTSNSTRVQPFVTRVGPLDPASQGVAFLELLYGGAGSFRLEELRNELHLYFIHC